MVLELTSWNIHVQDDCVQQLIKKDATLALLIKKVGNLQINIRPNPLKSLIRSIIGQQITVKVAASIFEQLTDAINDEWTVDKLSEIEDTQMKSFGLSKSKINYIHNLATHIQHGKLDLENLHKLSNDEVIRTLTEVKGIGQWTAEVFLLFTLQRPDVVPVHDVGLQRSAQWLYGTTKAQRKAQLALCSERWKHCASIGAFYLWEAIHQDYLAYASIHDIND